ncbi:MAG TPA: replication protein A [Allosphingosinicella sp.]|jgi:predicted transcriptional regulator
MSAARTSPESLQALSAGLFKDRRARTNQRVHRASYHEGEREGRLWRRHNTFADAEHNAWMRAAEELDDATRTTGKRNGAIGDIGLRVLRFMLRLRNRKTGRLDPSYAWLAAQINRSKSAVCRAVQRLKALGFLDWLRRTRPVEDPEPDGQYVKQISNAYLLELRGVAAEMVGRILRRPTEKMRRIVEEKQRADRDRADASRSATDVAAETADPDLRAILLSMASTIDARESKDQGAIPPEPINDTL